MPMPPGDSPAAAMSSRVSWVWMSICVAFCVCFNILVERVLATESCQWPCLAPVNIPYLSPSCYRVRPLPQEGLAGHDSPCYSSCMCSLQLYCYLLHALFHTLPCSTEVSVYTVGVQCWLRVTLVICVAAEGPMSIGALHPEGKTCVTFANKHTAHLTLEVRSDSEVSPKPPLECCRENVCLEQTYSNLLEFLLSLEIIDGNMEE